MKFLVEDTSDVPSGLPSIEIPQGWVSRLRNMGFGKCVPWEVVCGFRGQSCST